MWLRETPSYSCNLKQECRGKSISCSSLISAGDRIQRLWKSRQGPPFRQGEGGRQAQNDAVYAIITPGATWRRQTPTLSMDYDACGSTIGKQLCAVNLRVRVEGVDDVALAKSHPTDCPEEIPSPSPIRPPCVLRVCVCTSALFCVTYRQPPAENAPLSLSRGVGLARHTNEFAPCSMCEGARALLDGLRVSATRRRTGYVSWNLRIVRHCTGCLIPMEMG